MCYHRTVRTVGLDTSVIVSALLHAGGASREVLRRCLNGEYAPLMGAALFTEHEAVLSRENLFKNCTISAEEREALFDAYLSVCRWVRVYYTWRPNLPDESDNHVVELAIVGSAGLIVTKNVRDFAKAELKFLGVSIRSPEQLLKE